MKFMPFSLILLPLLFLTVSSCKTTEDIQREQMVDNLSLQVVEGQKLSASTSSRLERMEEKINALQGQIETSGHQGQENLNKELEAIKTDIASLKEENNTNHQEFKLIKNKLEEQDNFLKEVISTLEKMEGKKARGKKKVKEKGNLYQTALKNYRSGKYKASFDQFHDILKGRFDYKQKAHALHNIGMIEFMNKNFNQAIVLFSKLYSQYPKAPYVKNGLLFMGKSFQKINKKNEAKETYKQLIRLFPQSKQARDAKNILSKI